MKRLFLLFSILAATTLACDLSVTVAPATSLAPEPTNTPLPATGIPTLLTPTATSIAATIAPSATFTAIPASATSAPATLPPAPTATASRPPVDGMPVSAGWLSVVLSPGLASGARGGQVPGTQGEDISPWELAPAHTVFRLEGYRLQGKSQQPQIYVYPAMDYAEMLPGAFESIHRLDNILYGPITPIGVDQLPRVPFFNARQAFASNIQVVSFQNGQGVRFLSEYAQYPVSANNHDLFYQFQGVTRDGDYYIIAILPISAPVLAETGDPGAVLPAAGIPYSYYANPQADMSGYYNSVTDLLNTTPQATFTPTLEQLDALIQSMRVISQ